MPQLAAESAVAARISRSTADSELEDLVLAQTEDLRDSLTDELLLAQRDPTSMDEGMQLAQIEAEASRGMPPIPASFRWTDKWDCEGVMRSTKDKLGNWYWWGKWNGSNKEECWCFGQRKYGKEEGWFVAPGEGWGDLC